jgi:hypothetical protein
LLGPWLCSCDVLLHTDLDDLAAAVDHGGCRTSSAIEPGRYRARNCGVGCCGTSPFED